MCREAADNDARKRESSRPVDPHEDEWASIRCHRYERTEFRLRIKHGSARPLSPCCLFLPRHVMIVRIKPDLVLVSANGEGLERATASTVKEIIKKSPRPLTIVFRDPSKVTWHHAFDPGPS